MFSSLSFLAVLAIAVVALFHTTVTAAYVPQPITLSLSIDALTCRAIARVISSASAVYYPDSANYTSDIHHWEPSSIQAAACSVEPGTAQDVGRILNVLALYRSPFAVKSGGRFTDVRMSSTTGVQIALVRFNSVAVNKDKTVTIGLGQTWDEVYNKLNGTGLTIAGSRVTGVGTGGFILGGGYSYVSNGYGMAIDTVVSYDVVLPSGILVTASKTSYPDLFAGLKGGHNNFGIVVRATMRSYPINGAYSGIITYIDPSVFNRVWQALIDFHNTNQDGQGNIATQYVVTADGTRAIQVACTYLALNPPAGFFDSFTSIPNFSNTLISSDFATAVAATAVIADNSQQDRIQFGSVGIPTWTLPLIEAIVNLTNYYGTGGPGSIGTGTQVFVAIEPFRKTVINPDRFATAWPHDKLINPLNPAIRWPNNPALDNAARAAISGLISGVKAALRANKLDANLPVYPGFAAASQTNEEIYGANLLWLKPLRRKYDPLGIMLRCSGRKFI